MKFLFLAAAVVSVANAITKPVGIHFHAKAAREDPWPLSRGHATAQFGATEISPPRNLSASLAWSWSNPKGQYAQVVAGGPVIDGERSLYLTTSDGFYKFTADGETAWLYTPPGEAGSNNMPALMDGHVFGNTKDGYAFALDQKTGKELWVARPSESAGGDSGYPAAYDGLFVMGTEMGHDPRNEGGNNKVVALDAKTGKQVWEYRTQHPVWNVMPLFPGDDTCLFMDFTGGVYRVGLHNGTELWHSPAPGSDASFSDGGAILGPDNAVYSCSNPGDSGGGEAQKGALRAFRVSDGKMLWEQILPQPCNSWPAVGKLGGGSSLSVVVTPGAFMGTPTMHGGIMAFDAATGMPQWQYQAPVYHSPPGVDPITAAYGDYQGAADRTMAGVQAICLPAHWSCPTITGDGTVLAGRSDGKIYEVKGPKAQGGALLNLARASSTEQLGIDYATSAGVEVTTFGPKGASLHGAAAFAPGMMAFATCDSLYAFKF